MIDVAQGAAALLRCIVDVGWVLTWPLMKLLVLVSAWIVAVIWCRAMVIGQLLAQGFLTKAAPPPGPLPDLAGLMTSFAGLRSSNSTMLSLFSMTDTPRQETVLTESAPSMSQSFAAWAQKRALEMAVGAAVNFLAVR